MSTLKRSADTDPNGLIKDLVAQGKLADASAVPQAVADLQKQ